MSKPKKINHEYVCDVCGEPATRNIQDYWKEYEINKNGIFKEIRSWEGGTNKFFCDDHDER